MNQIERLRAEALKVPALEAENAALHRMLDAVTAKAAAQDVYIHDLSVERTRLLAELAPYRRQKLMAQLAEKNSGTHTQDPDAGAGPASG